jgi:hypothetical protein
MSSDSAAYGYDDTPAHGFLSVPGSSACGQCGCTEANGDHR